MTYETRYPRLNSFLIKHKAQIKVFADIGAGVTGGAPTTIEAKKILGEKAKVVAVDVFNPSVNLSQQGVDFLWHTIQRRPLPFKCDAIRFANVSHYMEKKVVEKALNNIWDSLNMGGFLLGSTVITNPKVQIGRGEHEFVFMKVKRTDQNPLGFIEIVLPKRKK
jgi:SAM-dependent methyltransferase